MSLLTKKRNSALHCHQLLLQTRAACATWEQLEKALSGKMAGTLPKDAFLASLSVAFPLKTGAELLALRQALYDQLDGRCTTGGFVGPDGSVCLNLPPATSSSPAASPRGTTSPRSHDDSPENKPVVAFDIKLDIDTDDMFSNGPNVLPPTPWNAIAAICYADAFGIPSRIVGMGAASPFLVELAVQYEQDVRRGERALANRLHAAASSMQSRAGAFENITTAQTFVVAWARSRTFAQEVMFGAPQLEDVDETEGVDPDATPSPTDASLLATSQRYKTGNRSMLRSSMSRSLGGGALERAIKDLAANTLMPSGGLFATQRLGWLLCSVMGEGVVGPVVATLAPPDTPSQATSWFTQLVKGAPTTSLFSLETALSRAVLSQTPPTLATAATSNVGTTAVDPSTLSKAPVTPQDWLAAIERCLPLSGSFLLRCASGYYTVPPSVFYASEQAFLKGVNLASTLHYDAPRVVKAASTASPSSPGRGDNSGAGAGSGAGNKPKKGK